MKLLEKLEKHMLKYEHRKKESHYPSEVTDCIRKLWYKWRGESISDSMSFASVLRMEMGNAIHSLLAKEFEEMGLKVLSEVPFKKSIEGLTYQISGRLDNLFIDSKGVIRGIEIKTTYGRGIRELRKVNMPKPEALQQVLVYFHCVDMKYYHLIYIGRDDGYRTEFLFERKEDGIYLEGEKLSLTFTDISDKLKEIEKAVGNGIPDRPYKAAINNGEIKDKFTYKKIDYKTDWQCSYCSYKTKCWKEVIKNSEGNRFHGEEEIK